MEILNKRITKDDLRRIAANGFIDLVKAVVDIDRAIIAIDAELHSDLEAMLIENGSKQKSLWGINFYPDAGQDDFIEFDSLINIRPSQGNTTRGVDDGKIRLKILELSAKWVINGS